MTRFLLTLESRSGAGIHSLRAILKDLLRWHGFRCVDAREITADVTREHVDAAQSFADQPNQKESDHEQSNSE